MNSWGQWITWYYKQLGSVENLVLGTVRANEKLGLMNSQGKWNTWYFEQLQGQWNTWYFKQLRSMEYLAL